MTKLDGVCFYTEFLNICFTFTREWHQMENRWKKNNKTIGPQICIQTLAIASHTEVDMRQLASHLL